MAAIGVVGMSRNGKIGVGQVVAGMGGGQRRVRLNVHNQACAISRAALNSQLMTASKITAAGDTVHTAYQPICWCILEHPAP